MLMGCFPVLSDEEASHMRVLMSEDVVARFRDVKVFGKDSAVMFWCNASVGYWSF